MGFRERNWYQDEQPKGGWRWWHEFDWTPMLMILGVLGLLVVALWLW